MRDQERKRERSGEKEREIRRKKKERTGEKKREIRRERKERSGEKEKEIRREKERERDRGEISKFLNWCFSAAHQ